MRRWYALPPRCAMATSTRHGRRHLRLPNKFQPMLIRLSPGDPGEFMRNRYVISIATALVAVLLVGATGCKSNPEKAKKKYLESGLSYVDKKQYDAAVIQFKKSLQADPKFAEAHYQLGLAYLHQQPPHVKEGYFELRQAAELDPKNLKARLEMGNILWSAREFKRAEDEARKVIEQDPDNAEGYSLLGTSLFALKDSDGALQAYNKVIELKPNDSGAYLNRGVLYASMKKDAEAEADFRKAVSLNPKNLEAYSNLSRFYQYKQEPAKAEEILQEGIKNDPDSPANYLRLAAMLLQEKRMADAETVIGNLRNRLPKNTDVAGAIAEFYLAARNPDAAIKEYQRGLSIDPKNERLTVALAEAYLMSGHIDEVTKLDEKILKDKPNDVAGRMIKGRLEAIKGDFAAAVLTFRGVVKDSPENPQAHFFLGQAMLKTGDLSGAKNEFQEAIKRNPNNPSYLQAQAEAYRAPCAPGAPATHPCGPAHPAAARRASIPGFRLRSIADRAPPGPLPWPGRALREDAPEDTLAGDVRHTPAKGAPCRPVPRSTTPPAGSLPTLPPGCPPATARSAPAGGTASAGAVPTAPPPPPGSTRPPALTRA